MFGLFSKGKMEILILKTIYSSDELIENMVSIVLDQSVKVRGRKIPEFAPKRDYKVMTHSVAEYYE